MSTPEFGIGPQTIGHCDQVGRARLLAISVLGQALDDIERGPERAGAERFCLGRGAAARAARRWWCSAAGVAPRRLQREAHERLSPHESTS